MSYNQLRSAVKVVEPQSLNSVNRLLLNLDYIFANERNKGIHVIDNRVPESPELIAFIEIPGNQDIAVKDGVHYADSYIDLVSLDISDNQNTVEIVNARIEDVFPYNSRQNIPDNVELRGPIDKDRGVVGGYR